MGSQICFDAAIEGVTGRLVWPARRCPTDAVLHPHSYGVGLSAMRAAAARHYFQTLDFLAHGFVEDGVG